MYVRAYVLSFSTFVVLVSTVRTRKVPVPVPHRLGWRTGSKYSYYGRYRPTRKVPYHTLGRHAGVHRIEESPLHARKNEHVRRMSTWYGAEFELRTSWTERAGMERPPARAMVGSRCCSSSRLLFDFSLLFWCLSSTMTFFYFTPCILNEHEASKRVSYFLLESSPGLIDCHAIEWANYGELVES